MIHHFAGVLRPTGTSQDCAAKLVNCRDGFRAQGQRNMSKAGNEPS